MSVYVSREARAADFRLQEVAIASYYSQIQTIAQNLGIAADVSMGQLLALPGVVNENETDNREPSDELTSETLVAVEEALKCLNRMREAEGANMSAELLGQIEKIRKQKDAIEEKARW